VRTNRDLTVPVEPHRPVHDRSRTEVLQTPTPVGPRDPGPQGNSPHRLTNELARAGDHPRNLSADACTLTAVPVAPEVSVVIPVRNGADSIPALLASLDGQTLERERYEVILVDNASRDDTARIAREAGVTVVSEPIANRSRARNRGIASAASDFIAFTDADCVAAPGWLEALIGCRGRSPLIAGDVRVRTADPPNLVERFESLWRFGQESWVADGWAATANLAADKRALDAIGGFDETWRHIGEDVDLCIRAGQEGFHLSFCRDALITHDAEHEPRAMLRRAFYHGYSVNQAHYRLGRGYRAWRHPRPLLDGDRALTLLGASQERFDEAEWRRLARMARTAYAARVLGSVWAEVQHAR
jgi:glycosyltransferase involved in cell wall biosynthesis